ncbi:MAG: SLATT domain-containing protein [Rhizomicrobium sp.]
MATNVEKLLEDMSSTKGARFNAAKRLEGRDKRMALLTAMASALVIALTVLPFIYRLTGTVSGDLSALTLAMSVLILAISLLQYSNNDAVNAEQHHRCALEINELRRELRARADVITPEQIKDFGERYGRILQKYSINQDDVDYDKYRLEHPEMHPLGWTARLRIHWRLALANNWQSAFMWLIVIFAVWFFVFHILPARDLGLQLTQPCIQDCPPKAK